MSKGKDEHQYAIIQRSSFINPQKPDYREEEEFKDKPNRWQNNVQTNNSLWTSLKNEKRHPRPEILIALMILIRKEINHILVAEIR